MNELNLYTGGGGGLLGTMLLGHIPIGYVEINEYCQQTTAQRIRDGILPIAPIFTDVYQFTQSGAAHEYRGIAELVSAGFPCQPFSLAGGMEAAADERNLWPATCEVIRIVRPGCVWLENVPGLISLGGYIGRIITDLASLGYVGRWGVMGAHHAGAPHKRARIWILAYSERYERQQPRDGSAGRMGWAPQPAPWNRDWKMAVRQFRRMDDGMAYGVERIDAIRNGQVPLVVAKAWSILNTN